MCRVECILNYYLINLLTKTVNLPTKFNLTHFIQVLFYNVIAHVFKTFTQKNFNRVVLKQVIFRSIIIFSIQ